MTNEEEEEGEEPSAWAKSLAAKCEKAGFDYFIWDLTPAAKKDEKKE